MELGKTLEEIEAMTLRERDLWAAYSRAEAARHQRERDAKEGVTVV